MRPEPTAPARAELQLVATQDGSPTCRAGVDGELFHNPKGAWSEAWQHYALPATTGHAALETSHELAWLDVCFGLGYGTWALAQRLQAHRWEPRPLAVVAFETDARLCELWPLLVDRLVRAGHLAPGLRLEEENQRSDPSKRFLRLLSPRGSWASIEVRLGDFRTSIAQLEPSVDWVLHDPFSPQRVPELWTAEIFAHYRRLLTNNQGRLLTYSTASAVLGGLNIAGFALYRTPALGTKRGGTMAAAGGLPRPLPEGLADLPASDQAALGTRSGIAYHDSTLQAKAREVSAQRNAAQRASLLPSRAPLSEY